MADNKKQSAFERGMNDALLLKRPLFRRINGRLVPLLTDEGYSSQKEREEYLDGYYDEGSLTGDD